VSPEEGYGSFNEEAIVDLDASIFKLDGTMSDQVFEGASLRMTSQDGAPMMGTVLKMTEDKVTMDFNHQLAGKELHFTGTVASVREATQEELDHGHVHGPGGHQH
jgi:FKBP-type peptidyl-prolyl cis-trans isomerase SlyD